ncbi:putative reverse transcriptase domain-containing protein [Tanacetum coccineum]
MRRQEWQRQAVDDLVVQHIMRTQALDAGARVDTLEDTNSTSRWYRSFVLSSYPALIDRGVADAMAEAEASRVRNGYDSNGSGPRPAQATTTPEAAHAMPWATLKKMMTDKYCPMGEIKKIETEMMFPEEVDKIEKYIDGLPDMILGSVEKKRKYDDLSKNNQNQQQQNKRQNTGQAYTTGNSDRKPYAESKPLCSKCDYNHEGPCPPRCNNCKKVGHLAKDCRSRPANANNNNRNNNNRNNNNNNQKGNGCYECGAQGHFKRNCPKLKNNDRGNQAGNDRAPTKVYVVGNAGANPDNVVVGTFLLNNRYAYILFDTGANQSFVSIAFSSQIDITPSTLDHYYDVELANGRIIGLNTILSGCTLNFLNHPFNINLMPVELGSFDAIIGMDWLAKYQAVIVCAEKIVHIPWGNETLIIHGDGSYQGNEVEDKSEKKRLEDMPIRSRLSLKYFLRTCRVSPLDKWSIKLICAPSFPYLRESKNSSQQRRFKEGFGHCVDAKRKGRRDQPLRVRALVMTIGLDLPKQILNAQTEARKPENIKNEDVEGMSWLPCYGDLRTVDSCNESPSNQNTLYIRVRQDVPRYKNYIGGPLCLSERTIQTLEDMLRACAIDFRKGWVNQLPLVEFSYNNSYHASIKAAPFEALYGRKCRSPVCWTEVGEAQILGPELIQETTEKIVQIKQRMQAARDRQKSYADLKAYVGPFKVLEKVGEVAYKLELPEELSRVHNTFHIMDRELERFEAKPQSYLSKVRWNSKRGPEFTWEREDQFKKKYPHLFTKTAPSSSAAS